MLTVACLLSSIPTASAVNCDENGTFQCNDPGSPQCCINGVKKTCCPTGTCFTGTCVVIVLGVVEYQAVACCNLHWYSNCSGC